MKKIRFDKSGKTPLPFTIILCHRNYEKLGVIHNVSGLKTDFNFNGRDEISFDVYKTLDGVKERLWDELYSLRIILIKELNLYLECEVTISESRENGVVKSVTAESICERELSQTILYGYEINTESDIEDYSAVHPFDDYIPVKIYNPENPKRSLIDLILERIPHYHIDHIDQSIARLQRSFSIDNQDIYTFLTQTLANEINCLVTFDTATRGISIYDLYSVCQNIECSYYQEKGYFYRGEFWDSCPKCGRSDHIYHYGLDLPIVVDKDNLTDEVNFSTDVGSIKNVFRLKSGDQFLDSAIAANNISSDRLYLFSEEQKHDMTPELREAIESYQTLRDSYEDEYQNIMEQLYEALDREMYYEHVMAPTHEKVDLYASEEVKKLTVANLSPTGIETLRDNTSITIANSAIESYAKCYIHSGYFKIKANADSFSPNTGQWVGTLTVTNYSDETDTATTPTLSINIIGANQNTSAYETYINQKCEKVIAQDAKKQKEDSIFTVLSPYVTVDNFKEYIKEFSLVRLKSFYDAIKACQEIMIQQGISNNGQSVDQQQAYEDIYIPYYDKLICLEGGMLSDGTTLYGEINTRQDSVDYWVDIEDDLTKQKETIQDLLDFEKYLNDRNLYDEFCSFRREDTYENSNFTSDLAVKNEDNALLFEEAQEFLEQANKDIVKSAEYQHSLSSNLYNLLCIEGFEPILDNFELGNFIRVRIDEDIYRLRLISYSLNFDDLTVLDTEFSDMTKTADSVNDVKSILSSAQQMATSYTHVQKQSTAGQEAGLTLEEFRTIGLNSALYRIQNNDEEEITYDRHGLIAKSYDDITDSYLDKQLKITHNVIAFTDDNWKTLRTALGEFDYVDENGNIITGKYGLNTDFCIGSFIQGGTIVGSKLYSPHTSRGNATILDLQSGNLSIGYDQMTYTAATNTLSINGGQIVGGSINLGNGTFTVDNNGNMYASSGTFSGNITGATGTFSGTIEADSGTIGGWSIGSNSIYKGSVSLNSSTGTISGATITGGSITIGSNFSVDTNGNATATNLIANDSIKLAKYADVYTSVYLRPRTGALELFIDSGQYAGILCGGVKSNGTVYIPDTVNTGSLTAAVGASWVQNWGVENASGSYNGYSGGRHSTIGHAIAATKSWVYDQGFSKGGSSSVSWSDITGKPNYFDDYSKSRNGTHTYFLYNVSRSGHTMDFTQADVSTSDERAKERIFNLPDISKIYMELRPVEFYYKNKKHFDEKKHFGLIAQEVERSLFKYGMQENSVIVDAPLEKDDDIYGEFGGHIYELHKDELHAFHIQMIQKQQREINGLKSQNQDLQNQINIIMSKLNQIIN